MNTEHKQMQHNGILIIQKQKGKKKTQMWDWAREVKQTVNLTPKKINLEISQ
jgi:hypothetical protein